MRESAPSTDVLAAALQGFGHPIRLRAIVLFEFEASPTQLAEAMDEPLGVVAYHVRMMRDYGLLRETRTEPKRGALQHYYQRTELADQLLALLLPMLAVPARGRTGKGQGRWNALAAWSLRVRDEALQAAA